MCKFAVGDEVTYANGERKATVVAIVPRAREYQRLVLVNEEGYILARSLEGKLGLVDSSLDMKKVPKVISDKIFRVACYNKRHENLSELQFHLRSTAIEYIERYQTENLVFGPITEDTITIEIKE